MLFKTHQKLRGFDNSQKMLRLEKLQTWTFRISRIFFWLVLHITCPQFIFIFEYSFFQWSVSIQNFSHFSKWNNYFCYLSHFSELICPGKSKKYSVTNSKNSSRFSWPRSSYRISIRILVTSLSIQLKNMKWLNVKNPTQTNESI